MDNYVQIIVQLKALGTELRTIRHETKMSQAAVADWLKLDRRTIIDIEAGQCLNFSAICKYADAFSIELKLNHTIF